MEGQRPSPEQGAFMGGGGGGGGGVLKENTYIGVYKA